MDFTVQRFTELSYMYLNLLTDSYDSYILAVFCVLLVELWSISNQRMWEVGECEKICQKLQGVLVLVLDETWRNFL
jgi:hypothetical protein